LEVADTKSNRSIEDSQAAMGMGATNVLERVAAAFGLLSGVATRFKASLDVPRGGVLLALPALLVSGLLSYTDKHFKLPNGYYQMSSIFLLLAFMALCRIRSVEQLRYSSPGEWGKLLGLDRVPEVRTLREKIRILFEDGEPEQWSSELCAQWMEAFPNEASVLYVDGHVRVYHGDQTKLPRHYCARERLCLRATIDYWVNAMDGKPFFLINKEVDPGLIKVMEEDIVPRLEKEIPNQPTQEELKKDPLLHRFTLIFDREGYSPDFIKRMKERRIACQTYHKYPGEAWPDEEFQLRSIQLCSGEVVEMWLAERGTFLGQKVWVREVRKKASNGKQTSILSTDYRSDIGPISVAMFARWSQENFFRYMREHYGLDRLIDYGTEEIPETVRVVNPDYRELDGQVRRKAAILGRKLAEFGSLNLEGEIEPKEVEMYVRKKAKLQEEIKHIQDEVAQLKTKRKATDKHISVSDLPQDQRFKRLRTSSKHFIDTIKMVAYRAETAMAHVVREKMARSDDARSLLRAIYNADADLIPDEDNKTLTVRIHNSATHCADEILRHLCSELNLSETLYPGTNVRLIYELVS
jgi:prepilin-type processing-associated H-X9-DG protein